VSRRKVDAGHFMPRLAIAERAGIVADGVQVELSKMRSKFRAIDPDFDHIESSVQGGTPGGWRWREHAVAKVIAHSQRAKLTLFADGTCDWRSLYRVHLSDLESRTLKLIMDAGGQWVNRRELAALTSNPDRLEAGNRVIELVRAKFRGADPKTPVILSRIGSGYCLAGVGAAA
jgi:hypothetical protein